MIKFFCDYVLKLLMYVLAQQISPMLEIGSLVQFGDPAQYGVIKKIEINKSGKVAEVETVSYMDITLVTYIILISYMCYANCLYLCI